jgi:tRNA (guanine-N(7)-)-methyltransferase
MRIRTHTNPLSYRQRFNKLIDYIAIDAKTTNEQQLPLSYKDINHVDFEIGFGNGDFLLNYAHHNPTRMVIGAEVRKKTVELFNERLKNHTISNILTLHGNGQICLEDVFDDHQVDNIFVFHPDPWIKQRHNNRRIINNDFLVLVHQKLKSSGKLYISTDVASLWESMLAIIKNNNNFALIDNHGFWQEFYSTRWTQMCREQQRTIFYGTFIPK